MPEANSEITMERRPGQLNEHQQSRQRVTCQYIDKLLSDMEDILHAASSSWPFPRYLVDLNPAQIRLIEDHIKRLRSQLIHSLKWQQMKPSHPSRWSDRIVRKLELLINSYADGYRMQIHRFCGTSDPAVNPGQLQADLELLKNWRPANSATLTDTLA
jgi:hypothetical protein